MGDALDTLAGRTLGDGAYTLLERIGSGSFGEVYRAEQPALSREVVVKILHLRFRDEQLIRSRFLREARLASRFDHPYSAHIYDFGIEAESIPWIAMELVRGPTLAAYQARHGRVPLEQLVPLFERICEVVEDAHQCGLVHRDLKPANIMILERGGRLYPKLVDFGLAKVWSQPDVAGAAAPLEAHAEPHAETLVGDLVGSPTYMSPEQWAQRPVGPATDIYALSIVGYQCLSGHPPFHGESLHELCYAHMKEPYPPLPAPLPAEVGAVLARAAAKDPADRFASATGFARALRAASGVGAGDAEHAPALGASLHRAVAEAPQPIAEAAAALAAARGVRGLRNAVREVYEVACRYLAALALACLRAEGLASPLLRALTDRAPSPPEWLELLAGLAPHCDRLPELAAFLRQPTAPSIPPLVELTSDALDRELEELDAFLGRIAFTSRARLVVPRAAIDAAEIWMGVRPLYRAVLPCPVDAEADGKPILVDGEGRTLVHLWPFAQVGAPAPEAGDEIFLLVGPGSPGRSEARLVASPRGFERYDASIWSWLRSDLQEGSLDAAHRVERAPYLGLEAYTADDAPRYVGREPQIELLANRLRTQPLLVITGPSGAGKSSFVQAGLLPALAPAWRGLVVRPGATPFASLAHRLVDELGDALEEQPTPEALRAEPQALARLLGVAARRSGTSIVLVVDQLEELFTLCPDAGERDAFAAAVAHAGSRRTEPVRAVVLVRDDFLARLEGFAAMRDPMAAGLHLLTTPSAAELSHILVELARREGYTFDEGLAGDMVAEVAGRPGALALLSFAAARLWELRDVEERRLVRRAFESMGGVSGALARHADEVLAQIPEHRHGLVREVFRQLVTAEGTRAPMALPELRRLLAAGDEDGAAVDRVVDRLIAARLVVVAEEGRVEIVHETLLSGWPRLAGWRLEDAEGARFRDQIRTAAASWHARGRPDGMLWRGEALLDYRHWRRHGGASLTEVEGEFVASSEREARRGTRLRRGAATVAVLFASAAVFVLWRARENADQQRQVAARNQGAAEKLVDYLLREMRGKLETIGRLDVLAGLGTEVAAYYENAVTTEQVALLRRAEALDVLGSAEKSAGKPELASGRVNEARKIYEQALAAAPHDLGLRRKLCRMTQRLGDLAVERSATAEAERSFGLAQACLEEAVAQHPGEAALHRALALLRWRQAGIAKTAGNYAQARSIYLRGRDDLAAAAKLGSHYPSDEAWLELTLALLDLDSGDLAAGLAQAERAVASRRAALAAAPHEGGRTQDLGRALRILSTIENRLGSWDAARRHGEESVTLHEGLFAREPSNLSWHSLLVIASIDRCEHFIFVGGREEGARHCGRAVTLARQIAAAAPDQVKPFVHVTQSAYLAGGQALASGDLAGARRYAVEAEEGSRRAQALAADDIDVASNRAEVLALTGRINLAARRGPEAVEQLSRAVGMTEELIARTDSNALRDALVALLIDLGDAEALAHDDAAAAQHHQRALGLAEARLPRSPGSVEVAVLVARARQRAAARAADPRPLRRSAEELLLAIGEERLTAEGRALLVALR